MRYLSVCSGIEAASAAWHDFGWTPVGFSEIEAFPSAVLAHRFPHVPNFGDMTKYKEWPLAAGSIDLLVGGTPCQSFSVAGLRKGLDDPRGNLMLTYLAIADHFRVPWLLWENVPGVLSSNGGRDFGAFVGALGQLGYRWAYRVLDAQYFGVPQRRRRVFVVARSGEGPHPGSVLFEPESMLRDPPKGRKKGKEAPAPAGEGVDERGLQRTVGTLCADTHPGAYSGQDAYTGRLIPHTSGSHWDGPNNPHPNLTTATGQIGYSNQEIFSQRGGGLVPHSEIYPIQDGREIQKAQNGLGISDADAPAYTIDTTGAQSVAICATDAMSVLAFSPLQGGRSMPVTAVCPTLEAGTGNKAPAIVIPTVNKHGPGSHTTHAAVCATGSATEDGTGRGTPIVPMAFAQNQLGEVRVGSVTNTLNTNSNASGRNTPSIAVATVVDPTPTATNAQHFDVYNHRLTGDVAGVIREQHGTNMNAVFQSQTMQVRRLTPTECERLQGFPDGWTDIPYRGKPAADGPRYKALGNSMAVPVMRWIGQRIKDA